MPLLDRYVDMGAAAPRNAASVDVSRLSGGGLIHAWPFFALDIKTAMYDWVNGRIAEPASPANMSRVEGPFGSCWRNSDGYPGINLGTDAMLFDEDFTFALWCVIEDYGPSSDGIAFTRMDSGVSSNSLDDTNSDFRFNWDGGAPYWHINASVSDSTNRENPGSKGTVEYNRSGATGPYKLQHLMLTRLGDTGYMYVDGILRDSYDGISGTTDQTGTRRFGISDPYASGGARYSQLSIFDFRVYNKGMNTGEAWRLYDPLTRWEIYRTPRPLFTGVSTGGASARTYDFAAFIPL